MHDTIIRFYQIKRFPFERNRDFHKNGTMISKVRTGDVFHPGLLSRLAGIDKCVEAVICPEEQYLYPGMDGRADVLEQKTDTEKGISGYSYFEDGDEGEARRYK